MLNPSGASIQSLVVDSELDGDAGRLLTSSQRWRELIAYQKETTGGGNNRHEADGDGFVSLNALYNIPYTAAGRYYLSCPETERLWAFRGVMEMLMQQNNGDINNNKNNNNNSKNTSIHYETATLSTLISKCETIAHRVDVLCQVDVPGAQRIERLQAYFAEACRLWLSAKGAAMALRVTGYRGEIGDEEDVYEWIVKVVIPAFT